MDAVIKIGWVIIMPPLGLKRQEKSRRNFAASACQTHHFSEELKVSRSFFVTLNKLKDKILNILGYLSQSLQRDRDLFYDAQDIWDELTGLGFSDDEIEMTLMHIEKISLDVPGVFWSEQIPVHRSYTSEEMSKLPTRVRGYLWRLKCRGVINHALEDEIVQKAMNLEEPAGLREIKTVAALTVFGYEHKVRTSHNNAPVSYTQLN